MLLFFVICLVLFCTCASDLVRVSTFLYPYTWGSIYRFFHFVVRIRIIYAYKIDSVFNLIFIASGVIFEQNLSPDFPRVRIAPVQQSAVDCVDVWIDSLELPQGWCTPETS